MRSRQARPMPGIVDVCRRERSWTIKAGSHSLHVMRVDHYTSFGEEHRLAREEPRKWRLVTVISAMLCVLGGSTTIALALNSTRAAAGYRYVLSRPVPDVQVRHAAPVQDRPSRVVRASNIVRPPVIAAAASASANDGEAGYIGDDIDPAPAAGGTMTAAVSAALASGTLQQWATPDGHERGFVVVGPMEAGDSGCRSISILVRRGGDNQVERRRECAINAASDIKSKP